MDAGQWGRSDSIHLPLYCYIHHLWATRTHLLTTAETAGHTIAYGNTRHYLLAHLALVGEPIMLAMRTHVK